MEYVLYMEALVYGFVFSMIVDFFGWGLRFMPIVLHTVLGR